MIIEQVDKTIYEHIRLVLVAQGFLPDIKLMADQAAYKAAKKVINDAGVKEVIEVFGNGSSESRDGTIPHKIVITRVASGAGEIGGGGAHIPEYEEWDDNGTIKYIKKVSGEGSRTYSYEIRVLTNSSKYDRILGIIINKALGLRRHVNLVDINTGAILTDEWLYLFSTGEVDLREPNLIERLHTYTIPDANITEEVLADGTDILISSNIPAMSSVNYSVFIDDEPVEDIILSDDTDATIILLDSDDNLIFTGLIPAGKTTSLTVEDSTNTFNGNLIAGVLAEGNKDITVVTDDVIPVQIGSKTIDEKGQLVIVVESTTIICVNAGEITKTGATISYATNDDASKKFGSGVDFYTLSYANQFGNTDRFTDDLGTQVYASDVVVDWTTFNQVSNTVLCYYRVPQATANLITHLAGQPYIKNVLSDWWICNHNQLLNIINYGILDGNYSQWFDYPPFNFFRVDGITDRIWSSTYIRTGVGMLVYATNVGSLANHTSSGKAFVCREYTLAELGL